MAYSDSQVKLKQTFMALVKALEISDPYTCGHSERVASLSVALGLELNLSTRELEILQDSGVLHDVGKIGVPKEILNKPGKLTPEEYEQIKLHPVHGYNILRPLELAEVLDITLLHHERMDGKGYPTGRSEYPVLVRVLQVADVWDALTSDRPYRAGMPFKKARALMGTDPAEFAFDPGILETFIKLTHYICPDDDAPDAELLPARVTRKLGGQPIVSVAAIGF